MACDTFSVVQVARRRSTIIEVAARANVAFSTVSRVLNGGYASPEVRARVEQAARELNYTPSSAKTCVSGSAPARRSAPRSAVDAMRQKYYLRREDRQD